MGRRSVSIEIRRQNETIAKSFRRKRNAVPHQRAPKRRRVNRVEPIALMSLEVMPEDVVISHNCGLLSNACSNCYARYFDGEVTSAGVYYQCCHNGTVKLPVENAFPQTLLNLYTGNDDTSKNFRCNIRNYNSALAFASFGHHALHPPGRGPQTFVIHGQVYHATGLCDGKPKYSQLYIFDPSQALHERLLHKANSECLETTMSSLSNVLSEVNPYSQAYKTLRDVLTLDEREYGTCVAVKMYITTEKDSDLRRYNLPTSNDVAVIFRTGDGNPPTDRDICVHPKGQKKMINLKISNPNCDPMTYPLLFPRGTLGWHENLPLDTTNKRKTMSMLEFYAFKLQIRDHLNIILLAEKLFQQYVVDAYSKVEASRIDWCRLNQKTLRVDMYVGLMDFVQNKATNLGVKAGKVCILPSSFTGSPRAMQQNYQDAMAIVGKYGKPDLFITFTCNPKWTEIIENLEPYQSSENRPDLVSRVFKLKLKSFLEDINRKGIFGKVVAHIYVIEFQKRGLPHAHMLFILSEESKFREPEEINKIVSAEIPDPERTPRLYDIVTRHMIHGPCGVLNPKAPCMLRDDNGVSTCSKGFPKNFSDVTNPNVDGYPIYQRKDDGKVHTVRGASVDNRFVVPYNPYLCLKYNAHINVEVCSSVKSVKYIFKYVYKGHDAAKVLISERRNTAGPTAQPTLEWDEIQNYIDTRYVGAPEAIWRLFENKMHDHSHTIVRLAVHGPGQQSVVFQPGSEELALTSAAERDTTLTAWFELNKSTTVASNLLYPNIPYSYVFDKGSKSWKPRKKGSNSIISRMYAVNPMDTEKFCLRLLLLHVPGAKSFEHLKTVNGRLYKTFQEAAKELNLLESDQQWEQTLQDAVCFQMPRQLRELFAIICVFGNPADALNLWTTYCGDLTEDYRRSTSEENSMFLALQDIENVLRFYGKSLIDYKLPTDFARTSSLELYDLVNENLEANQKVSRLNDDQRLAYNAIMNSVNKQRLRDGKCQIHFEDHEDKYEDNARCFFVDGPGGSGKTYLYQCLQHRIRGAGGHVISVAPTGLAATLLIGGRTVHSAFKLPLTITEDSTSNIRHNAKEAHTLKQCDLIIWDEISMCHKYMLECVNKLFQDLMDNNLPFGGKTIVVGGDFRQQLPVVKHGYRTKTLEACVKNSRIWQKFRKFQLKNNMRAIGDSEFTDWLLCLGEGKLENSYDLGNDTIVIPPEFLTKSLITDVFGDDISGLTSEELAERAILCPKNEESLTTNENILSKLEGELATYVSIDKVLSDNVEEIIQYPVEFLNSLTPSGMAPHKLNLKVGCCIMLLRNLGLKGLCNGTRLIVKRMQRNVLDCEILTGEMRGERVFIPRITLNPSDVDLPFTLSRKQFPVRLAYCMTITKSQGQTLSVVGIYLPQPVFTHGQLYTAFSRGKSKKNIKVDICETSSQGKLVNSCDATFTANVVYKQALV